MSANEQKTILLVEDETLIALMEKETLKRHNFNVILASSGEKAVKIVQTMPDIDLILMDINLGKGSMDGTNTAKIILSEKDIPILFLSSYTQAEVVEKTENITSYGYVVKDSGETVLIASIKMAFKLYESQQRLKEREETLRESSELVQLLLNSTAEAIYGLDMNGLCTFCNTACLRMLGYEISEQLLGKNMHNLIHHTHADGTPFEVSDCSIFKAFILGKGTHVDHEILWRADGTSFPAEYWSYPVRRDGSVIGSVVTFMDITEHRKLEEQLRHAQKMESIGLLAGGIAHDFNNILGTIMGYGEMALIKIDANDPLRLNIEHMLDSVDKAAHLTKDLLIFSRKQTAEKKPVDLCIIIKSVGKILTRVLGEDIQLKAIIPEGDMIVLADAHHIEQVLMNLATNARDAMPKGGVLSITVEETAFDDEFIAVHGYGYIGKYAMIVIADTGEGMDAETRQKIFEPFFTTKEVGKGTGLGMAVVHGIIKQHDGYINVYSEPGIGTTFRIYLPLIKSAKIREEVTTVKPYPVGGTETILLAEDNESFMNLMLDILKEFGYNVITASDGEDAVKKFNEHKDIIKLLLFDVIMPKQNGKDTYDEIAKINPDIKVIFLSGYAPDMIRQKLSMEIGISVISKPISPINLLNEVRKVLDDE